MKYVVIFLLSTFTAMAAERQWEASIDVNEDVLFSVSNHKGLVKIEVGNSNKVIIDAKVYMPDSADYTEAEAQKVIDSVDFDLQESKRSVRLDIDLDTNFGEISKLFSRKNQTHPMVDLVITVPARASLDVETHKGTLEVDAPSGPIKVETHKGTGYVHGVQDDLKIETHKGTLDVTIDQLADLSIETHKGDVKVSVSGAENFRIDGDTHKGSLRFSGYDIPVKADEDDKHGSYVKYKQGTGENRIKLQTHKGSIRISFQ